MQDSPDLDSLNHVASGIVTSLNLVGNEQTVVYYEQQAGQDIGREATVMTGVFTFQSILERGLPMNK